MKTDRRIVDAPGIIAAQFNWVNACIISADGDRGKDFYADDFHRLEQKIDKLLVLLAPVNEDQITNTKKSNTWTKVQDVDGWLDNSSGLTWLSETKDNVTWAQAMAWAKSKNARLPTKEELEHIGFNGNKGWKFLNMESKDNDGHYRWFWSSSLVGDYYASYLDGFSGYVNAFSRGNSYGSARCVR